MRHKNGTTMAQPRDKWGAAAVASRGKVKNISNFGDTCFGNYFCSGTIWLLMALISGKNSGKNSRLLRKTMEYSQLVVWKILFALS
jgi:hypothetical protein